MKAVVLMILCLPLFLGCSHPAKQGEWILTDSGVRVRVDSCQYAASGDHNTVWVVYSVENKSQSTHDVLWKTKRLEDAQQRRWEAKRGVNAVAQPMTTVQAETQFDVPAATDMNNLTFGNATLIKLAGQAQDQGQADDNKPLAYKVKLSPSRR